MKRVAEIREEIAQNVKHTRNKTILENVHAITDLMRRAYDPKEYTALTDAERSKVSIINSIVGMNDPGRLRIMQIIGDRVYRK